MKAIITTLTLLTLALTARAELNSYLDLSLNGTDIEGEPKVSNLGGVDLSTFIECLAFQHEVFTTFDESSGRPTGRRQHKPITIIKSVDKATPLLYEGLFNNQLGEASFHFFRRDNDTGAAVHFQTITLTDVSVVRVRRYQPNTLDPASADSPLLEEVSFRYENIQIEHIGGATARDSSTSSS